MNITSGKKICSNEINTYFLIHVLFEGNVNKALKVARRYPRATYTLTPKSIERELILKAIADGISDVDIVASLSDEDNKIDKNRVVRLRKEFLSGKYRD